ncbi:hypothetical protein PR048_028060 [Dryococelus australis]|uniref:Uncharacterized protein n=1 Tax=Dryococelus australis TaxID=614101 RepID=A0ABQ9GI59_9NEOP|nr:hypothetical protein PR048_028060 [Dryococelus australis]
MESPEFSISFPMCYLVASVSFCSTNRVAVQISDHSPNVLENECRTRQTLSCTYVLNLSPSLSPSPPSLPLSLPNCESKPFSNPLEHTQKISSKSVQPFRRRRGKRKIPKKTCRLAASSGTILAYEIRSDPAGDWTRFALMGGEQSNRSATAVRCPLACSEQAEGISFTYCKQRKEVRLRRLQSRLCHSAGRRTKTGELLRVRLRTLIYTTLTFRGVAVDRWKT